MLRPEPAPHHGCGPCTDTFISLNPFTIPATHHTNTAVSGLLAEAPLEDLVLPSMGRSLIFMACHESRLIPIKTTSLLL